MASPVDASPSSDAVDDPDDDALLTTESTLVKPGGNLTNKAETAEVPKTGGSSASADSARYTSTPQYKPKWGSSSGNSQPRTVHNNPPPGGHDDAASSDHVRPDFSDSVSASAPSSDNDDGGDDDLPAFADASNKALHKETKRLELLRQETERAVKAHRERVEMMEDHLNEVKQEIEHTDGLMEAKQKEIETEQHLLALSEREGSRYGKEIKEATDEVDADKQRVKTMQARIISTKEETEKLKLALNWNQEELEQWVAAAARKEEDNLALQRYARADEAKIKELSLSIENLTKLSVEKRALLDNETKQTVSYQMELDRIAENFKAQHGERKEFVKQWQDTVATMRARDEEISRLSTQYAQVENVLEEQMSSVAKHREALAMLEVSYYCFVLFTTFGLSPLDTPPARAHHTNAHLSICFIHLPPFIID